MDALLFLVVVTLLAVLALYWVIRLAVRHALHDADRERRGAGADPRHLDRAARAAYAAALRESRLAVPDPDDRR